MCDPLQCACEGFVDVMKGVEACPIRVKVPEENRAGRGTIRGFGDFLELEMPGFLEGGESGADRGGLSEGNGGELLM